MFTFRRAGIHGSLTGSGDNEANQVTPKQTFKNPGGNEGVTVLLLNIAAAPLTRSSSTSRNGFPLRLTRDLNDIFRREHVYELVAPSKL